MTSKKTSEDYFRLIKQNHKRYLEHNMLTHLELTGGLKKAKLVEDYTKKLIHFRPTKERYLDSAIQQLPLSSKIGHGALSALLGLGISGLTASATQKIGISSGAFSTVLAAGASNIAYKAWKESAKNASEDFSAFQEAMKQAGFNDERYNALSASLVKLFHFRECILLKLEDNNGINIREEFKTRYFPQEKGFDEDALNLAIEAYFLDELNALFNSAFKDIYELQEDSIKDEKKNLIFNWLKLFFEKPEHRQRFSQQMQIQFMEECLNYLETEMAEPSFYARHPYASASVMGLLGVLLALSLAAAVIGGPIIGIVGIGLLGSCLAAASAYWALKKVEAVKYKRTGTNREAIAATIHNVTNECRRLDRLIKNSVDTSPLDVKLLQKYQEDGSPSMFHKLCLFFDHHHEVAMGASTAWLREYASRYRHSKAIEIELGKAHQGIIERSERQTHELQKELAEWMLKGQHKSPPKKLQSFVYDSENYLRKPEHQVFIERFELTEKIRQQVLEIVGSLPYTTDTLSLPGLLIDFYTSPLHHGGLGGQLEDLAMARLLSPTTLPFDMLLLTAQRVSYAQSKSPYYTYLLKGDNLYRKMLGLSIQSNFELTEHNITPGNINHYLKHSFDFLFSLNEGISARQGDVNLAKPFKLSHEFVLYRALLIKQLASIADPNNLRTDPIVRAEINRWIEEQLRISPTVVFNDVVNQSLFLEEDASSITILDPLGIAHPVSEISFIAEALRLDLAYASRSYTPSMLIDQEAKAFLSKRKPHEKIIFCQRDTQTLMTPEDTETYHLKIKQVILNTSHFIEHLTHNNTIKKSKTLDCYLHDMILELQVLIEKIERQDGLFSKTYGRSNPSYLHLAFESLKHFSLELDGLLTRESNQLKVLNKTLDLTFEDWSAVTPKSNFTHTTCNGIAFFTQTISKRIQGIHESFEVDPLLRSG
ncbi:hypothetical protein [Legionella impletisoli]|uniref:Uncharacterized protein n=1 Tax=Legionella impletisoli TaxID=343510 RepID=A0A917JQS5_9GAMM|nr:hypothetical protein [Legionella impletisoli]GGI81631.1 hypothetical protein GCM10007966_07640 [Legionella impletisoli]